MIKTRSCCTYFFIDLGKLVHPIQFNNINMVVRKIEIVVERWQAVGQTAPTMLTQTVYKNKKIIIRARIKKKKNLSFYIR